MKAFDVAALEPGITTIVEELGFRLYDIQVNDVARIVRVMIDREHEAVTIGDCAQVSRALSQHLDRTDPIPVPYTLEVSSPGVNRPLKRPEHYRWSRGKTVMIDLGTRTLKGFLRDVREEGIVVAVQDKEEYLPYALIRRAKVAEEPDYGKRR